MVVNGSGVRWRWAMHREAAAERDADGDDEERRGDELRDGRRRHAGQDDRPIRDPVPSPGREQPGQDADRDGQDERQGGQLGRAADGRRERRHHGLVRHERVAEVERDEVAHRAHVLLDERIVRAQLLVERVDALLGRERAQDRPPDVGRQDVGDDEHEGGQQPQRDQRQEQPPQDEPCHGVRPLIARPIWSGATRAWLRRPGVGVACWTISRPSRPPGRTSAPARWSRRP